MTVQEIVTALKKLLTDKTRKYPVTPESVVINAIETRVKSLTPQFTAQEIGAYNIYTGESWI